MNERPAVSSGRPGAMDRMNAMAVSTLSQPENAAALPLSAAKAVTLTPLSSIMSAGSRESSSWIQNASAGCGSWQ